MNPFFPSLIIGALLSGWLIADERTPKPFEPPVAWEYSAALISPEKRERDASHAQKDPTLVFHDGKWHLFMTVKLANRTAIEYCSFASWDRADASPRTLLAVSDSKYFGAPQVFYFTPHKKWYLVYQVGMPNQKKMMVAYSTTAKIADPTSWTKAVAILDGGPADPRLEGGLDYWVICDARRAHLFFTSLNGKLWRMSTRLGDFPRGFDHAEIALQGPFFEASHTYRLKGSGQFLTIIEADGRRHYKAYVADTLDGGWTPIADTTGKPFAGAANIRPGKGVDAWTDNVSHGELVRDGVDESMTVDAAKLQFVFQGMLEKDKPGKKYGQFQWQIGILTPER